MTDSLQSWDEVAFAGRPWCVVHGDCREVLPRMWPGFATLLLTDPPYGLSDEEGEEITRDGSKALSQDFGPWDRRPLEELETLIREALGAANLPLHEHGAAYVFASDKLFEATRRALAEKLFCQQLSFGSWCKSNPAPSNRKSTWLSATELMVIGRRAGNPFHFPDHRSAYNWMEAAVPHFTKRRHPCEKPLAVLERIIRASSSSGDVVLDPFCGGGAVGEAALRTGRRFVGIDLDPQYAARAQARLEQISPAIAVVPAPSTAAAP